MFQILLLVVSAFFAGMMVFAAWEAWLAYRIYLDVEVEVEGEGEVTEASGLPQFPEPAAPVETVPEQVETVREATPEAPVREVDEEVLAAIAAADHYLDESELDDLFGPTPEG